MAISIFSIHYEIAWVVPLPRNDSETGISYAWGFTSIHDMKTRSPAATEVLLMENAIILDYTLLNQVVAYGMF